MKKTIQTQDSKSEVLQKAILANAHTIDFRIMCPNKRELKMRTALINVSAFVFLISKTTLAPPSSSIFMCYNDIVNVLIDLSLGRWISKNLRGKTTSSSPCLPPLPFLPYPSLSHILLHLHLDLWLHCLNY